MLSALCDCAGCTLQKVAVVLPFNASEITFCMMHLTVVIAGCIELMTFEIMVNTAFDVIV